MTTTAACSFGQRSAYNQSDLIDGGTTFSQAAAVDGFVVATVGQPSFTDDYLGTLEGFTVDGQGNTTCFVYATGLSYSYTTPNGKKGATTIKIPMPGSFTLPTRAGETWNLRLTWNPAIGPAPAVEFYWVPMDGSGAPSLPAQVRPSAMAQGMSRLHSDVRSGKMQSAALVSAQQAINERVLDLTHILGDSINQNGSEQQREQFTHDLQKIVCTPVPAGTRSDNTVAPDDLKRLINSFSALAGHTFSNQQADLIDAGVRALVQINDNESNRRDLSLINRNIGLFIDNVQQVLQKQFSRSETRLLTRALVRLVGNGQG